MHTKQINGKSMKTNNEKYSCKNTCTHTQLCNKVRLSLLWDVKIHTTVCWGTENSRTLKAVVIFPQKCLPSRVENYEKYRGLALSPPCLQIKNMEGRKNSDRARPLLSNYAGVGQYPPTGWLFPPPPCFYLETEPVPDAETLRTTQLRKMGFFLR